jgi:hypothetical protein
MRVLICGARDYEDKHLMFSMLDEFHADHDFDVVIEGGARGADSFAAEWAILRHIPILEFRADWEQYGRSAGPIRNREMLVKGFPQIVIAFPKTVLSHSKGTKNMVEQAKKAGITTIVVERQSDRIKTYLA